MVDEKKQRVLQSAMEVFIRYGFKRVTMGDLAEAAGVSRPALYLLFRSKEEIFTALLDFRSRLTISSITEGLDHFKTPPEKIFFVFDKYVIEGFDRLAGTPEGRELLESKFLFAREMQDQNYKRLENLIVPLIQLYPKSALAKGVTAKQAAHLIVSSVRGFKQQCETTEELREMVKQLISMSLRG